MRIRKKKWARPELAACPFYVHEPKTAAGTWGERFKKQQPIHLDLGCGKCTFLAKLAHREKDVNFIGIDISEDILGVARRNIEAEFGEEPVENVNLLSYNIEKLDTLFAPDEKAARIYVNFCNPWQKAGDHKRRLTHTRQLNTYKKVLAPGGELWFKTDNTDLYLATQRYLAEAGFEILCKTDDLHSEDAPGNIQSEHEVMFTAEGIKTNVTLIFSANQALLAARAGATYVSPFLGRLDDISTRGVDLIREIVEIFDVAGIDTEIIAASVRNPIHVTDCALAGADIATVPYNVIVQMTKHPLTDAGIAKFQADYKAVFGE